MATLGIDLGTGSVKALLMAPEGTVLAEASAPYAVNAPQPGWAETPPEDWWAAVAIAVSQISQSQRGAVEAIALSGQMHGVVLCAANGQPLYPAILWADGRAAPLLDAWRRLPEDWQHRLGNPIATGMAGPTLLWLRDQQPALYQRARWMLQPKDWLCLRLTGIAASEPSDASATLLYDLLGDPRCPAGWFADLLQCLSLRTDGLPPLGASTQVAGSLTAAAAAALGLTAGTPVIAGAGDTAAGLLGSGMITTGPIQLTIGTGAQIATLRPQPLPDPRRRTHLFCAALPQQWYSLAAIQNAGLALEWARGIVGMRWEQVYATTRAVPPGCEGLTFLPYLTGDRTPHLNPNARGGWIGLGLNHTPAHLMRAALEGVAFSIRQGLEALLDTGIAAPAELRLAGGGSVDPGWVQLLADILQCPLRRVTTPAASARGAAILAGLGIGMYDTADQIPLPDIAGDATLPQELDPRLQQAGDRLLHSYTALNTPRSTQQVH